jgi:hypothetical protein
MRAELLRRGDRVVHGFDVGGFDDWGLGWGLEQSLPSSITNVYSGFGPQGQDVTQTLQSGLQSACSLCSSPEVQNAISAYQGMGPAASTAIGDFAKGNVLGGIQAATPIIGAAITAMTGNPVAGAVVVGILEIGEEVAVGLGLFQAKPPQVVNCSYVIFPIVPSNFAPGGKGSTPLQTGVCFQNSVFTPNPALIEDPSNPATSIVTNPNWITLEQFMAGGSAQVGPSNQPYTVSWQSVNPSFNPEPDPTAGLNSGGISLPGTTWADVAFFPWFSGSGPNAGQTLANGFNFPQNGSDTLRGSLYFAGIPMVQYKGQALPASPAPNPNALIYPPAWQKMLQGIGGSSGAGQPADIQDRIIGFISGFCQVFSRAVCERIINNHTPIDPNTLLQACAQAWNAQHSAVAQYTFDITNPGSTFVDAVMQGNVPLPPSSFGQSPQGIASGESVTINVGPSALDIIGGDGGIIKSTGPTATTTPATSTGTALAVGALVVGAAAAGGLYLYSDAKGISMLEALKKIF